MKTFEDSKAFIEYSNNIKDISKKNDHFSANKKRKKLILFYDKIADMLINKET